MCTSSASITKYAGQNSWDNSPFSPFHPPPPHNPCRYNVFFFLTIPLASGEQGWAERKGKERKGKENMHMNPKLTCSQREWLHSSVGRASHRYRQVTGSSPVEVLNFFQASLRNCKNCDHNCEDHSSFEECDTYALAIHQETIVMSQITDTAL